jgi:hypothetical protein
LCIANRGPTTSIAPWPRGSLNKTSSGVQAYSLAGERSEKADLRWHVVCESENVNVDVGVWANEMGRRFFAGNCSQSRRMSDAKELSTIHPTSFFPYTTFANGMKFADEQRSSKMYDGARSLIREGWVRLYSLYHLDLLSLSHPTSANRIENGQHSENMSDHGLFQWWSRCRTR